MSTCGCTGQCKTPPYTCGGFETLEEVESYLTNRYKILNGKQIKKEEKCPNCGCELKNETKVEFLTED